MPTNRIISTRITNPQTLELKAAELQAAERRPPPLSVEEQIRAMLPKYVIQKKPKRKAKDVPKSEIKNLGAGTVYFT